ncbi:MAG: SHOCT domain-containing protein [Proteobacteria bacterium]|nr:SHOCT domain-containing protein [Pseudomonadota bacterium]MBU1389024.1 SHOCT domain-containing protein [Pseudomonadota bacterium]MBU1543576.1 SHOCT domain-containing protein [Pseudomonadota bacterium]MBU2429677.1 SHOCT domain-containing protein [Pseudomonadota bacterium]MBU2481436.1 SHOCT domain-containing protein [Pseudomonadota bacterium]
MIFKKDSVVQNIFIAGSIILLHILLLAAVGMAVLLFGGVYTYLPWVMGLIAVLAAGSVWLFFRRLKSNSPDIQKILSRPEFQNRTIEIKLLGGLASFKIEPDSRQAPEISHTSGQTRQLIYDNTHRIETRILELNTLFEKKLITEEEFKAAKHELLQG